MDKNAKIGVVLVAVFLFTPIIPAIFPQTSAFGAGAGWNWLTGFSTTGEPPIGDNVASKWQFLTRSWGAAASLTVDNAYTLVNGVEIPEPTKAAGYVEYEHPVRTGDRIQVQFVESGYYTVIHEYVVPMLDTLPGGTTYYQFGTVLMYGNSHATSAVLSATYQGTDIDAANFDISASTDYSIAITIDLTAATFDDLAFGGEDYTEIVGDLDEYGKFVHIDCNDSDIVIKDIELGVAGNFHSLGTPVFSTFAVGSDKQWIWKFSDMLVNDGKKSNDGSYELRMVLNCGDETNEIVIYMYDFCDVELAKLGSPSSTVTESVTITTE